MLGAHLDSVAAGPGINDNGSGTAALLEIAEQLAKKRVRLTNQVAFAFWGAEENGLVGSTYFVEHLSPAQKARVMANLNFDMLASPNFVRFVRDGDLSDTADPGEGVFAPAARPGSAAIEAVFARYFARSGSRSTRRRSTGARTTARSSRRASRPAGCSPAPRA